MTAVGNVIGECYEYNALEECYERVPWGSALRNAMKECYEKCYGERYGGVR
jgi:hypothetical protein